MKTKRTEEKETVDGFDNLNPKDVAGRGVHMLINVHSKGKYPADALSNFAPHRFDFDGFENIPCMEAFLQSLKFSNEAEQREILYLPAKEAKKRGSEQTWERFLYWKGKQIDRFSDAYMQLVESAYLAMLENEDFRAALRASKGKLLFHTVGRFSRRHTVLTRREFCAMLYKMRKIALLKYPPTDNKA